MNPYDPHIILPRTILSTYESPTADIGPMIAAAFASGAKRIFLPAGTYRVSTSVTIPSGCTLEGESEDVTTINCANTSTYAFKRIGEGGPDLINGITIRQLRFIGLGDGSNNAYGAVSLQDAFRCTFEKCTFWGFQSGQAVALINDIQWTEGVRFYNCMWRDCYISVLFHIVGSGGAQASFAETVFQDCTFELQIPGGAVFRTRRDTSVLASIYYSKFEIKVHIGQPEAFATKCSIFDFSSGGVRCSFNRYAIGIENTNDRAYYRFNCGNDVLVDGIGFSTIDPSLDTNGERMERFVNATHPYDNIALNSMVYLSPAGLFSPANGQFGDQDAAEVHCGAGVPVALAKKLSTSAGEALVYFTEGIYEISLVARLGTSYHAMLFSVSVRRGTMSSSLDADLVILTEHHSGTQLIDRNSTAAPRILSTTDNNAVLYANFINIDGSAEIDVCVTHKSYYKSPGSGGFGPFKPFVIFPDPSQYTTSATIILARFAAPRSNLTATANPTASDDSGLGYAIGSDWYRTDTQKLWRCVSAVNGAANWVLLN